MNNGYTAENIDDVFRLESKKAMPNDKEILEIDEYIDLLMEIIDRMAAQYKDRIVNLDIYQGEDKMPYRSSMFEMFLSYQKETGRDRTEFKNILRSAFVRQDETLFLNNNNNISSAYLMNGLLPHWHKNAYFDIVYVFEGQSRFYFRDETLTLSAGDVLIVPPEIDHGEATLNENDLTMTSAIRRDNFLNIFLNVFAGNQLLHSFFSRILSGDQTIEYLKFTTNTVKKTDRRLDQLFKELYNEQNSDLPYHSQMCDAIMNNIFVHILRYYENSLTLPQNNNMNWKKEYASIFRYINDNYKDVTLEKLENEFHYSRRQLIRIIRSSTGQNFSDIIKYMKLQHAAVLLRETGLPVEEIVNECGYENPSSFARLFREQYDMTPTKYRNQMRECRK